MSPWFDFPALAACGKVYRKGKTGSFDVVLVSGDAYVDHPSFGTAVIARRLEKLGLKVAVIAQPDWKSPNDFKVFGAPNLFFGVTSGSMDSMVANFTSMRLPRKEDKLSPGGRPGFRPKRAVQVYCQRLKEIFPKVPIVIGGIESSLRRFSHYDFWEDRIRDSILVDSGADLLVYGMAEAVLPVIVESFEKPEFARFLGIPQTCVRIPHGSFKELFPEKKFILLPSATECRETPKAFMELTLVVDVSNRPDFPILVQPHPKGDIVCFPPSWEGRNLEPSLISGNLYNRRCHPLYDEPVPGLEPVRFSVISHYGCVGACSFCALGAHQGRVIRSRPIESIVDEVSAFPSHPDFRGTVPDIGGPSAEMFGWKCRKHGCAKGICTFPKICVNLDYGLKAFVDLLRRCNQIPGIEHVFVGSGVRFDLIKDFEWSDFEFLVKNHVSGQLKVAPEHVSFGVLRLMRKQTAIDFAVFLKKFSESFENCFPQKFVVPYFMTSFPGSSEKDVLIAELVRKFKLASRQIQEFTPTPGTVATAMFYSGLDFFGNEVSVVKLDSSRRVGKKLIQSSVVKTLENSRKYRKSPLDRARKKSPRP